MNPDLQLAVEMAEQAGRLTLTYFSRKSLQIFTKRDASPVTEADRNAEELIRSAITLHNPADGVLGEEFEERPSMNGRRWIIDPIDGTKAFIHGVPLYGVMIALEVEGIVRLGVVNFPALGDLYYGELGCGAFLNGSPITVSSVSNIADATCSILKRSTCLIHPPFILWICCAMKRALSVAGVTVMATCWLRQAVPKSQLIKS